jgi:hypothetical protein
MIRATVNGECRMPNDKPVNTKWRNGESHSSFSSLSAASHSALTAVWHSAFGIRN